MGVHQLAEERYRKIIDQIQREGGIVVSRISRELGVSDMTVRRDLKRMEDRGLLTRVHGGAVAAASARFGDRLSTNTAGKRKAVKKLESFLPKSGAIYLDGSTTILNLIERIKTSHGLMVVTNNMEAFNRLAHVAGVEALLIGGRLDRRTDNMVGSLATRSLGALAFDAAFFSAWGIAPNTGPMEVTLEDAEVKELVARHSGRVYLAVDATKLDRHAGGIWEAPAGITTFATDLEPKDKRLDPYRERFQAVL